MGPRSLRLSLSVPRAADYRDATGFGVRGICTACFFGGFTMDFGWSVPDLMPSFNALWTSYRAESC